jgi:hypothetical protein
MANTADHRSAIAVALKEFQARPVAQAARNLLAELGYKSDRTIQLSSSNPRAFLEFIQANGPDVPFSEAKALYSDWKSAELLFQITDEEVSGHLNLFKETAVNPGLLRSYLFFAIELTGENYTRGKLTGIARQINRVFPMPVMVLIKHQAEKRPVLSIAVINRRQSKRDAAKDVLGKVTIIRDISLSEPHRGHLDILDSFAVPNLIHPQRLYDDNFATDDPAKITLKLGVTTSPSFTGTNQQNSRFIVPEIEFGIQVDGKTVTRPQSFLNEAKLTQLALSLRFAASLVNLHESDLKLLVLDDLLVSLDMSNRMNVVEILLSNAFADYQKISLTHELGFFREFRRKLGASHPEWCFLRLEGTAATKIIADDEKTNIQKAESYLYGHSLDEAALCLRKACEDTAKRFIDHNEVLPTKEFLGLAEALRAARNRVFAGLPVQIYEKVLRNTPDAHRSLLVASTDDDLDGNASLDEATKGRLKTNRERLRRLVTAEHVERLRQIKLIDDILACTERVLNPSAHSGTPPLYEKEVQDALKLVKELEATLSS